MSRPYSEIGIIGGTPGDRLLAATKTRRAGISTFTEYRDAKRRAAFKRADAAAWSVYDLDREEDRREFEELAA